MSDKTLIEWNADVGHRFLTIHPDGSFDIDKDAPPLFVIGELAKAFIRQQQRIKRLEEAERWIPANTKPEGCERKVLLWIVWPNVREWCDSPEPLIGWWKHGPQCFALGDIENADHLVRYWMEIPDPTEAKEAKP